MIITQNSLSGIVPRGSHLQRQRPWAALWLTLALSALILSGCDMTATPLIPTPSLPVATPQVLGVITGPTGDAGTNADTAPAAAIPVNESMPAWTVMVFSSSDTPAGSYSLESLNQMEAAGDSTQVQVVAAVDWPAGIDGVNSLPARYVIQGDHDPGTLISEEAVGAEETNFGDPQVLSEFMTWAMTTYPANHYALILDGYGAGNQGCCLDMDPAGASMPDFLTLTEIQGALAAALGDGTNASDARSKLDLIGFSGSLMGDLEVFQSLGPYADYAVASAAPVPGNGWNYETLLGALYADPWQDGRSLASLMATNYMDYHQHLLGNEFVTMTAVDLARIPELTTAVETLALTLSSEGVGGFGAAAGARRGVQTYGAVLAGVDSPPTSVDLGHAAAILTAISPAPDVAVAARAVSVAADNAIVAQSVGQGLPFAMGVGIYWPVAASEADPIAPSPLPNWGAFLNEFTDFTAGLARPLITVAPVGEALAGQSSPALIHSEVLGQQIDFLQTITTQADDTGTATLLQLDTIPAPLMSIPGENNPDNPTSAYAWPDGRYESIRAWDANTAYLYDAAGASSAALLRAVDQSAAGALTGVSGALTPVGATQALDSVLEFPQANAVPAHVWHSATVVPGTTFVHELPVAPGDRFIPNLYRQSADGGWQSVPAEELTFDAIPALYRSIRPLNNGTYQTGLASAALGNNSAADTVAVMVNQSDAVAGYRAFSDPKLGVAIVYPESWTPPQADTNMIHTADSSGDTTLQIREVEPWLDDSAALLADAIANLGDITILFEDTATIPDGAEGIPAARVAYGYPGADGRIRTGILTAFTQDGRGTLIDLDGLQGDETALIAIAETIVGHWRFLPDTGTLYPPWGHVVLAGYDVAYPPGMTFKDADGWYRFVAADRFMAFRAQPLARTSEEALSALLAAAGDGVEAFQLLDSGPTYLNNAIWQQGRFVYQDATGAPVGGLILTRPDGDSEIAIWGEWSITEDAAHSEAVVRAMAAAVQPGPAPASQ